MATSVDHTIVYLEPYSVGHVLTRLSDYGPIETWPVISRNGGIICSGCITRTIAEKIAIALNQVYSHGL